MIKVSPRIIFWLIFAALFLAGSFFVLPSKSPKDFQPATSQQNPSPAGEPLKILFGGDVFLDRSIRRTIEANTFDFIWEKIKPFLQNYDYIVANLEGPVWNKPQAAPSGSFSFAFQEDYVRQLKSLGFTAVSLANNHTLNQGSEALAYTRTFLESIGLDYFGDPNNEVEFSYSLAEWQGQKIALVGEHDLVPVGQKEILDKISQLDAAGHFIIVLPHWGPEYVLDIPAVEQNRAYQLVDAGADLIIGSHPHVVQPIEIYGGKAIFYSLGNFLFDQGFSYDTMHGLLVEVTFEQEGLRFNLYPTEQNRNFQINLASDEARNLMLSRLSVASVVPEQIRDDIKLGSFYLPK